MSAIQFIGTIPNDLIQEIKKEIIPELKEQLKEEFQPKELTSTLPVAKYVNCFILTE